jgi:hypothetical protein
MTASMKPVSVLRAAAFGPLVELEAEIALEALRVAYTFAPGSSRSWEWEAVSY